MAYPPDQDLFDLSNDENPYKDIFQDYELQTENHNNNHDYIHNKAKKNNFEPLMTVMGGIGCGLFIVTLTILVAIRLRSNATRNRSNSNGKLKL